MICPFKIISVNWNLNLDPRDIFRAPCKRIYFEISFYSNTSDENFNKRTIFHIRKPDITRAKREFRSNWKYNVSPSANENWNQCRTNKDREKERRKKPVKSVHKQSDVSIFPQFSRGLIGSNFIPYRIALCRGIQDTFAKKEDRGTSARWWFRVK